MAITLCQSLGQNIGMKWNNARSSAGKGGSRDRGMNGINDQTMRTT